MLMIYVRDVATAVKNAREVALLPYTSTVR